MYLLTCFLCTCLPNLTCTGKKLGREWFGVMPLRGKMLNVRDVTTKKLMNNKEIGNLITVLGLDLNKTYSTEKERSSLR